MSNKEKLIKGIPFKYKRHAEDNVDIICRLTTLDLGTSKKMFIQDISLDNEWMSDKNKYECNEYICDVSSIGHVHVNWYTFILNRLIYGTLKIDSLIFIE